MTGGNFINALVAHLAYMEGKESVNSMLAVAFCLKNRANEGQEGGDLSRIVQAELLKRQLLRQSIEVPDVRDPSFIQLLGFIDGVLDGTIPDKLTNGGIYYGPKPWGSKEKVATVGQLEIWR